MNVFIRDISSETLSKWWIGAEHFPFHTGLSKVASCQQKSPPT